MQITVWNEYHQERTDPKIAAVYPGGIHAALAAGLAEQFGDGAAVGTATLDQPDHGLTEEVLDGTDVLLWWAHLRHDRVADEVVDRVRRHVLGGMGLIILHSAIEAKITRALLGTSCRMSWWRHGDRELIWTVDPAHPIADGLPNPIELAAGEMYGEPLDVPTPDELIFITGYAGGEVLRSGCGWHRGAGRVFFFAAGHEEYPIYHDAHIRTALGNIVRWAAPRRPHRVAEQKVPMLADGWWRTARSSESLPEPPITVPEPVEGQAR